MTDIESSIMATKQGFEYFLPIKADMKILDLGTGSGYLSFSIAKKYSNISVTGLDIVEKALEVNRFKAKEENIQNISFMTYDGMDFPFSDSEFDMVISRYALHHFPTMKPLGGKDQ